MALPSNCNHPLPAVGSWEARRGGILDQTEPNRTGSLRIHLGSRAIDSRIVALVALDELGIGFVPFSPLGAGFLIGKINENTKFDSNFSSGRDRLAARPKAVDRADPRYNEAALS